MVTGWQPGAGNIFVGSGSLSPSKKLYRRVLATPEHSTVVTVLIGRDRAVTSNTIVTAVPMSSFIITLIITKKLR